MGVDGGIWGRWSDMGVDGGRRLIYMGREGFKKEIVSNEQFQDFVSQCWAERGHRLSTC